jgi:hypothetical protein
MIKFLTRFLFVALLCGNASGGWLPLVAQAGLNFQASTGTLPGGWSDTRSTTANYYNSSGIVASAAINTARFSYNPSTLAGPYLLVEPAATNLVIASQTFNNGSYWYLGNGPTTIVAAATTAPDGTTTGQQSVENNGAMDNSGPLETISGVSTGNIYTDSIFAKAYQRTRIALDCDNGAGSGFIAGFDLSGGQIGYGPATDGASPPTSVTATIQALPSSWYRVSVTFTWASTAPNCGYFIDAGSGTAAEDTVYTGNGIDGLYIWGAQVVASASPISYIPTVSGTVAQSADAISLTIPAGVGHLTYTFSDNTTQVVSVSPGAYTIPTTLNKSLIKSIVGSV